MPTYQSQSFLTLRQELQRRLRSTDTGTGVSDLITAINRALNNALHDITTASWFEWTVREFWWMTTPPVASATTQAMWITAGQTLATFSGGGAVTTGMSGRILLVSGGKTPYEIVTVSQIASPLSLNIAGGYEGTVNAAAGSFRIIRDSFNLSDLTATDGTSGSRIRAIRRVILEAGTNRWPLTYVPARNWDSIYPRTLNESQPSYYTVIRWTSDGEGRLRLWPIPDTRYVLRVPAYCWLPELSADADTAEMPGTAHRVLCDLAYARLLRETIHEEMGIVAMAEGKAQEGLAQLKRENFVKPDWDMARGESPYAGRGMPVVVLPSEFGYPVDPWI